MQTPLEMSTFTGQHSYVSYTCQELATGLLPEKVLSDKPKPFKRLAFIEQHLVDESYCLRRCRCAHSSITSGSYRKKEQVKLHKLRCYRNHPSSHHPTISKGFEMRFQVLGKGPPYNPFMLSCEQASNDEDKFVTSTSARNDLSSSQLDGVTAKKINQGLSALDAYFNKLSAIKDGRPMDPETLRHAVDLVPTSEKEVTSLSSSSPVVDLDCEPKLLQGLKSLDAYFNKLQPSVEQAKKISLQGPLPMIPKNQAKHMSEEEELLHVLKEFEETFEGSLKAGEERNSVKTTGEIENVEVTSTWELRSDSYTVNVFVAMNIAVYLFGLASQQQAYDMGDSSLPFLYGAKVNELILDGQWWRLITPIFLHSGLLHIGLGSWALLSFGPAIERAYGPLGFLMIYLVGGTFGNLSSFFHTTEGTVGGTGPIYALVGAWVVYLIRNRQAIGKDVAADMIQKVVIMAALNVALGDSLPIDDWTHIGAAFAGAFFGILASPIVQMNFSLRNPANSSRNKMEPVLVFNESPSPVQLIFAFIVCIGVFIFLYEYGLPNAANEFFMLQGGEDLF